ncbi:MAG: thiazole synthase [Planctomycetales bacterium]|nr:thiazole synthase [Planctomycetales bacterium]
MLGTGKYATFELMAAALEASGCDLVTVAVRRVNLSGPSGKEPSLLDFVDRKRHTLLPNTAGCYNAVDAVRAARLGREAGLSDLVKLEVLGDPKSLLPDPLETLEATKVLVKEGFQVWAYTSDDPIMARKLADAGAACVMPLGAPIGSGQGILNPNNILLIRDECSRLGVPMVVDAGVGTASDVAVAMELGADGVLLNTGVALAADPVAMARAMSHAIRAGRLAFCAGRIPKRPTGAPSSPTQGVIAPAGGPSRAT